MQGSAMSPSQQAQANYQANLAVRNLWVHGRPDMYIPPAVDMWQPLNPFQPSVFTPGTVLTWPLRNVGLVKRLLLKITGTVTAGAQNQAITAFGLANLISNVQFTDLANNQRVNTTGWHLVAVASVKRRRVWGSAATTDTPFGYGNNFSTITAAAAINAGNTGNFTAFFEIPFVRNDHDLRGAVFGDTSTAQMQVQVTLNPGMFVAAGADATNAFYQSAAANTATLTAFTWQLYQNYLDQGPRDNNNQPVLPRLDIGTAYVLNNTSSTTPVANQDNAVPFVNQRQFLSTFIVYDNAGTLNVGTDLSNINVTSANFTNIRFLDPIAMSLFPRLQIGDDLPKGMYYFDFNDRPIDTAQYGNMQIIVRPSAVGGATAVLLFGWEAYGIIGLINQGGSLPSGAGM